MRMKNLLNTKFLLLVLIGLYGLQTMTAILHAPAPVPASNAAALQQMNERVTELTTANEKLLKHAGNLAHYVKTLEQRDSVMADRYNVTINALDNVKNSTHENLSRIAAYGADDLQREYAALKDTTGAGFDEHP